ncbi:MAG: (Fe-S)-binding protein [Dehalococcoidia bacterium]|nr:(Fe-S)-binding protein [Dehalococcoidia bacterium]
MSQHATQRPKPTALPKRVSLFVTCLVDQFMPETGESVVRVLERLGVEVDFPEGQTCCGQPAFNSGFWSDAKPVARRFLDVFEGENLIVTPSGSCAAMVRNFYPELFHDEPETLARVRQTADRVWEFSEFIVDVLGRADLGGALDEKATYHKCCHLLRELNVDRQPAALLAGVKGLALAPLERAEVCCGFGGTFSVKMSPVSTAMLNEKLDNVAATGAKTLIAGDAGCIMHMAGGLRRRRSDVQVVHMAQLLDRALARIPTPTHSDPLSLVPRRAQGAPEGKGPTRP